MNNLNPDFSYTIGDMPIVAFGTTHYKPGSVTIAIKAGCRHIDCVHDGEEVQIGNELAVLFKEKYIMREELFITSKLWNTHQHQKEVVRACHQSICNLQCRYLDLYIMHWNRDPNEITEDEPTCLGRAWDAMASAKYMGYTNAIGVSNFKNHHYIEMMSACLTSYVPECAQIEFNPYCQNPEMLHAAFNRAIPIIAYSPFGGGITLFQNPVLVSLAKKYSTSVATVILSWITHYGFGVCFRSQSPEHIVNNLNQLDDCKIPWTFEELRSMNSLYDP
jgi:diketogulonate reductase-like aldo/keto reductase